MRPKALVTGASSGIGRAAAVALSRAGYDIFVGFGQAEQAATEVARQICADGCGSAYPVKLTLSDPEQSVREVQTLLDECGPVQVLANNAGVNRRSPALEESYSAWQEVMNVNLHSPFLLSQLLARHMVASGTAGRIVNVTSVHERIPISGGSAYCTAKAGLGMLTRTMALELGPYGITVNSVAPGETATPMNNHDPNVDPRDVRRPALPLGRPGDPAEVAALITYLCSPAADYITGQAFVIDGGLELIAADANVQIASAHG
jgi:NAD(P)-dependent dehydrogenase (short-subunit alcohol dehydrogenase family)